MDTLTSKNSGWFVAGALLALLIPEAPSDAQTCSRSYIRSTGNSNTGGRLSCYGMLSRSSGNYRAKGEITASVRLFGRTYEVGHVKGESKVENYRNSHTALLRILGRTYYSATRSAGWSWDWGYTRTFFRKSRTFWLACIPINCEVSAGGRAYADLDIGLGTSGAKVNGRGGANAWGSGTVGLDLICYRPGIRADITFFDTWLEMNMLARSSGISGTVTYKSDPLTILLKLVLDQAYISVSWSGIKRRWKEIASLTLTNWSAGRYSNTFLRY